MLVLTRKLGQELVIGDNVIVSVVRVQGNRVKLGIKAPPDVLIRREKARSPALEGRGRSSCRADSHSVEPFATIDPA